MRQVRLALGPEALIVSNRRVNGGVEILATDSTSIEGAVEHGGTPYVAPAEPDPDVGVMSAIGEMRGVLETRIDELLWGTQLRRAPQAVSLFQTLLGFGFSTALLRAMLKRLPEHLSAKAAFQWARNELITHLPVIASEDAIWTTGQVLALVGPTGVGKTTTIAKLAARCVRRSGPDSLVLLTTDTYRIGAHEQLKIYGQILRVPVHVVQDVAGLRDIVQGIRADQTVLIDNVGISQRDRYITEQAAMLAGAGRAVNRVLVLNASSHGDTLDEVARNYANDGGSPLVGCIISKIDEASRLGAALDTAIRYKLPIHYVSNGQKVPENLAHLQAQELVDHALEHNQHARALYAPTEADIAALMSATSNTPQNDAAAAQADARRKRLLPGLLSMAGDLGGSLSNDDLHAACSYIDEQPAVSEAYDLWRSFSAAEPGGTTVAACIRHMLRVAQKEPLDSVTGRILAIHDQVPLKSADNGRGHLRASLMLTADGKALSTTMQQLAFADGWHSSCGAASLQAPTAGAALLHQIQWLAQEHGEMPLVHAFEGGTQTVWRQVCALGVSWLAQTSGTARIEFESCATTIAAVAKTLRHSPIADTAIVPDLTEIAGLPARDVVLWTATQVIDVTARQQAALPLRLISVRVVDRRDGKTIKTLYGLSNMVDSFVAPERLAAWLLVRVEARMAMRYAARAWQLMPARHSVDAQQKKAMTSMQAGMAAWQMKQGVDAVEARKVGESLVAKPGLPAVTAAAALLKLFALKEMVAT